MKYFDVHVLISYLLLQISCGLKSGTWLNVRDLEALQEVIENVFNSTDTVDVKSLLGEYKKYTHLKGVSIDDLYVYFSNIGVKFICE